MSDNVGSSHDMSDEVGSSHDMSDEVGSSHDMSVKRFVDACWMNDIDTVRELLGKVDINASSCHSADASPEKATLSLVLAELAESLGKVESEEEEIKNKKEVLAAVEEEVKRKKEALAAEKEEVKRKKEALAAKEEEVKCWPLPLDYRG